MAEVTTEDGVTGFGYIVALNQMFIGTVAAATRELAPLLTGMSVAEPEAAWKKMARAGDWVGPGGLLHYAIAPLDIAVWDAFGKTLGQPCRAFWAGRATGCRFMPATGSGTASAWMNSRRRRSGRATPGSARLNCGSATKTIRRAKSRAYARCGTPSARASRS